ncbi:alpha/beta-hydrolase [Atractiella rhizophila]|nr:alpha/beta-hydrolase [Atractiella rhizophila]
MGQSGGGFGVVGQMTLYDGKKPNFKRTIPRSIQRSPSFTVSELSERNAAIAAVLNCPSSSSQLACFRKANASDFVNAVLSVNGGGKWGGNSGFVPTVDGYTLTDTVTRLFQSGKFAKVPMIAGTVTDESAAATPKTSSITNTSSIGAFNMSSEYLSKVQSFYPFNSTFASRSGTANFFVNEWRAAVQANAGLGEGGIACSERLVNAAMAEYGGNTKHWGFRFEAPTVTQGGPTGVAWVAHSADNSYLQNATAVMTEQELEVAEEWRGYIGSFIKTGDPNTERVKDSVYWPPYNALGDYNNSPVRLVPAFRFPSNPGTGTQQKTGTQLEVMQRPGLERCDWWLSEEVIAQIRA